MRAAIGYQREWQYVPKPKLTIWSDKLFNVGRLCAYKNSDRIWQVKTPLRDQEWRWYYLIENIKTGEIRISRSRDLHFIWDGAA